MPNETLSTLLEEYKSIRSESLLSIQTQTSVISFGIAGFGAMLGLSFQNFEKMSPLMLAVLLFWVMLIFLYGVLFLWTGELRRMVRAGNYLTIIGYKINGQLLYSAVYWEKWLRQKPNVRGATRQMRINYVL